MSAIDVLPVRDIPIAKLHGAEWNTNRVPDGVLKRIRRSLETFGAVENLVVRPSPLKRGHFEVVSGNHRLDLYREAGVASVPCVVVELDDARARLLSITLNRTRGVADDPDAYKAALEEILKKFTGQEIASYLPTSEASIEKALQRPTKGELDLALKPPARPRSKAGTVYELGPHRLMCGDATKAADVSKLLDGAEPILLTTDPPYGVELDRSWSWKPKNSPNPQRDPKRKATGLEHYMPRRSTILGDTRADWSEAYELVPSLAVAYVWHAGSRAGEVQAGLERVGFEIAQQIIWDKGQFALSRSHYQWQHEAAWYAVHRELDVPWYAPNSMPAWYARKRGVKAPWLGARDQSTIWVAPSPKMSAGSWGTRAKGAEDEPVDHPTQKPAELYLRPIRNHLRAGEQLYDPFGGSGTAVIAAQASGRVAFVMELDPSFVDVIRKRYSEFVGDPSLAP